MLCSTHWASYLTYTYDLMRSSPPSHEKTGVSIMQVGKLRQLSQICPSKAHVLLTAQELHVPRIFLLTPTPGHNTAGFF